MSYDERIKYKSINMEKLSRDINWDQLPGSLIEIKKIAGGPTALTLAFAYGGCRVYMPRNVHSGHPFVMLMGYAATLALSRAYGGSRITIPKKDAILRQLRMKDMQYDRKRGATIDSLARKHNLSRRRILQLLAQYRTSG